MARKSTPSSSPARWIGTTFGWSIDAAILDSAMKRLRKPCSAASSGAMSLSATVRSSVTSTAA
jgi:hypothetical protein